MELSLPVSKINGMEEIDIGAEDTETTGKRTMVISHLPEQLVVEAALSPEERKKLRQERFGIQLDDSQKKELRKQKFGTASSEDKKKQREERFGKILAPEDVSAHRTVPHPLRKGYKRK